MIETLKRDWKAVLFQSVAFAVVLILLLVLTTAATGGFTKQNEAVQYQKAIACELAVPVTDMGRDPVLVAQCFTDQGVEPPSFQRP